MDEGTIRKHIRIGFEYSYLHDDWVNPLADALEGVTASEALSRPCPDCKGIWDMVLHMAVWNENIVERIRTGKPGRPADGAWPPIADPPDEEAWERAKQRLMNSLESVRETIESTPLGVIEASPWGLGDLFCRFIHNAYHIGQITKMREYMEA